MKKSRRPVGIVIVLLVILGGVLVVPRLIERYSYSKERADLDALFQVRDAQDVPVILGDEAIEAHARLFDDTYYMTFDAVQTYLNDRFYDGREDGTLIYTTPNAILTVPVGGHSCNSSDGSSVQEDYVIARYEGETLYVALPFVRKYTNFRYAGFAEPNRMQLETQERARRTATVTKDTALRVRGGIKSEIVTDLYRGDSVFILEEMETWTKVQTSDAFTGYVENKRIEEGGVTETFLPDDAEIFEYTSIRKPYKINLSWHNVAGAAGNDTLRGLVEGTKSLNVVSPTWYSLSHNDGSFASFSSAAYVKEAHALGLDVWALINDIDYQDSISDYAILSGAESRAGLINGLMREVSETGIDGINVDFEHIDERTGESYIEFLRELSIACRERGIVLSVDNYVPKDFNRHYHRKEQGVVADYVIIMGYDEHGSFSDEAGSVASIDFVTEGIEATIAEVPAEKVINAVPFYTRIWSTEGSTLTSRALGMEQAELFLQNHAMTKEWDEVTGQYYAEKTEGNVRYQVWMEDAESIAVKLQVMKNNGLAGVASWKLGFDVPDVWDAVTAYLHG